MLNQRFLFFIFICFGFYASIYSQNYVFEAQKINVEDGLPHRSANDITQDLDGFIWISTPGIINKYDGYHFKSYDSKFLNVNEKNSLFLGVDLYNRIWFCERDSYAKKTNSALIEAKSDSLLNVYDISNGLFSNLDILHINQSTHNKTDIFITTRQGYMYKYNGQFEEIYKFPNTANQYPVCDEISKNSYWILNGRDLLKIKNQKLVKSYKIPKEKDNLNRIINKTPNLIIESRDPLNNVSYWELKNDELIPLKFKYLEDET